MSNGAAKKRFEVAREVRAWIATFAIVATTLFTIFTLVNSLIPFLNASSSPTAKIELSNGETMMTVKGQVHIVTVTPTNYSGAGTMWVVVQSPNTGEFNSQSSPVSRSTSAQKVKVFIGGPADSWEYRVYVVLAGPQHAAAFGRAPLNTTGGPLPDGITFLASATFDRTS